MALPSLPPRSTIYIHTYQPSYLPTYLLIYLPINTASYYLTKSLSKLLVLELSSMEIQCRRRSSVSQHKIPIKILTGGPTNLKAK